MILYYEGRKFREAVFDKEEELEKEVINNYKLFFGNRTIYVDAKRRLETKALGGVIPDGFLFDFSDRKAPEFYIVEIELAKHDFYRHVFPQITKYFAFFRNPQSQNDLVEKLHEIVDTSEDLKAEFKKYLGEQEIYKSIKDVVDVSQNILLIFDEVRKEVEELNETYTDTWGKTVKLAVVKKFGYKGEYIFTVNPEFEEIEYSFAEPVTEFDEEIADRYTEDFHLEGVKEPIESAYSKLKEKLINLDKGLRFNPQKYYISVIHRKNIAFLLFRRKKIHLVAKLPEKEVKKIIKKHKIKRLGEAVQKFYGSPCCDVIIEDQKHMGEVVNLFKELIRVSSQ